MAALAMTETEAAPRGERLPVNAEVAAALAALRAMEVELWRADKDGRSVSSCLSQGLVSFLTTESRYVRRRPDGSVGLEIAIGAHPLLGEPTIMDGAARLAWAREMAAREAAAGGDNAD